MTKITQAFIFCAGRGERMRPLTDSTPKPLLEVKNKKILDYILVKLQEVSSLEKIGLVMILLKRLFMIFFLSVFLFLKHINFRCGGSSQVWKKYV